MTDLLSRPSPASSRPPLGGARPTPPRRPLSVSAPVAGAVAALAPLLVCLGFGVLGWFLADGGAHGTPSGGMRVGALVWLQAQGAALTVNGVPETVLPLGLTGLLLLTSYRAGRWAGRTSARTRENEFGMGLSLLVSTYLVVVVVTAVVTGSDSVTPSMPLAVLGGLVVGGVGALGLIGGAGRWSILLDRLPAWGVPVLRTARTVLAAVLAAAGLLLLVSLLVHLGSVTSMVTRLGLHPSDVLMLVVLCLGVLPNAVLWSAAYLLGPGFAVGTGTTVAPTAVTLGPLPAFPLLGALPDGGPVPWWTTLLLVVPAVAAAAGVFWAHREETFDWDVAAARGAGSGALAGLVVGLLAAVSGGSLGTGRMADLGPATWPVLGAAVLSLALGGLIGAVLAVAHSRRRPTDPT